MAKRPLIFLRLPLLFLICSSCAWVGNVVADGPAPVIVQGRDGVGGAGGPEPVWEGVVGEVEEDLDGRHPRSPPDAEPAHVVRGGCQAMITPPPSLLGRQDQGQIQALSEQLQRISDQFRSVSQASQQVSQSSQQLSQSLQQATQRLSQTEQELASARLQQGAAESASRSMSQASAEASRRADEAIRSISQSASSAISASMASFASSMGASFSSALQLASQSAADASRSAASVAQKAQEDATALRVTSPSQKHPRRRHELTNLHQDEANSQIQRAQGAALSVTQTALAVVGGIIGSSLLTGVIFVIVLRRRRTKRRQRDRGMGSDGANVGNIGHPQLTGTSNKAYSVSSAKKGYAVSDDGRSSSSSTYSTDADGFRFPAGVQQPPAAMTTDTGGGIPRKSISPAAAGVGYAVSYYGPRPSRASGEEAAGATSTATATATTAAAAAAPSTTFRLGKPPPPRGATGASSSSSSLSSSSASASEAKGGKFTVFPNSGFKFNLENTQPSTTQQQQQKQQEKEENEDEKSGKRRTTASDGSSQPSLTLDRWLRDGTDVSPFPMLKGKVTD
ncbi:hypothetical protein VTG60DRAFT_2913 [Thermothelomyces hinnuleus]